MIGIVIGATSFRCFSHRCHAVVLHDEDPGMPTFRGQLDRMHAASCLRRTLGILGLPGIRRQHPTYCRVGMLGWQSSLLKHRATRTDPG